MRFRATVELHGRSATGIQVPDEVVAALGPSKRPPVRVTIGNHHTYRSSVASMGGRFRVGISAENRAATGVAAGDEIHVDLDLDTEPRAVTGPTDLAEALDADGAARKAFDALASSHQLRHVLAIEAAKAADTRQRRVAKAVACCATAEAPADRRPRGDRPTTATSSQCIPCAYRRGAMNQPLSDDEAMGVALEEAAMAPHHGDVPVGAVALIGGAVVARGHNQREQEGDPTAHAELVVLRAAAALAGSWRLQDVTLVVTLEPCPMCAGALVAARVGRLVFGATDPRAGAAGSLYNLCVDPRLNHELPVTPGVRAAEAAGLLTTFFASRRGC